MIELTPAEERLILALREMIGSPVTNDADEPLGGECEALSPDRRMRCIKPAHKGRHTFRPIPIPPPARDWETIDSFMLQSGSRKYPIAVGSPVKVKPKPIGSPGVDAGWKVSKIERSTVDPERINVSVRRPDDAKERTVPSGQILYKRPPK